MAYRKIIYELLRREGGGCISGGTLAIMAGCSRRTVSRVISALESDGLICVQRNHKRPHNYNL